MKLSLITEVFQTPSLDGVMARHSDSSSNYKFKDDSVETSYEISIYFKEDVHYKNQILIKVPSDEMKELLSNYNGSGSIYLSFESPNIKTSKFQTTGLGNQYFVYGKLIAAIQDFVTRHNCLFLVFSGAESGMELMYDQMIKWSNRKFPNQAFVHLMNDVYVRSDVKRLMPKDQAAEDNRKTDLENAKWIKDRERKRRLEKMQKPTPPDDLVTEVFQTPSLDDIEINDHESSTSYYFDDDKVDMSYEVKMTKLSGISPRNSLLLRVPSIEMEEVLSNYGDDIGAVALYAKVDYDGDEYEFNDGDINDGNSTDATGLGNNYFVYGRLIACIHDFVTRHNLLFLKFTGAQDGMDLLYDKMIKWGNRQHPDLSFSHLSGSLYVRSDVKKLIPKDQAADDIRKEELKSIRERKNRMRQARMNKRSRFTIHDDDVS